MRDFISQLRRIMGDLEAWTGTDSMVLLCALGPMLSGPTSKKKTQLYWEFLLGEPQRERDPALKNSKPVEETQCILLTLTC